MFKEVVESKIKDPVGRLTRLIKFTDGEGKDLMNKRYGNTYSLLASHRKEIKLLALIKPGDAMDFRKFLNFETFSKITNSNSLETPKALCSCVKTTKWFKR